MEPKLVVTAGPLLGAIFKIDEEISVGRETFNQISIGDPLVSRQHCRIKAEDDGFKISDLNSFNGTFVNGLPVDEQWLNHCDRITIGDSQFIFLLHGESPLPASDPVELNERNLVTRSTVQLQKEEALYLNPEKIAKASPPTTSLMRDLAALLKIGTIINSVRELDALQRQLLESVFEIIPAERGAILLLESSGGEFISTFGLNRSQEPERAIQVSQTVVREAIRTGAAILLSDVSEHEEWRAAESLMLTQTRSVLCVPLTIFERKLGAIYLSSSKPEAGFNENHLQLMTAVASMVAVAIENARHIERLTTENQRLQADIEVEHNMIGNSQRMRAAYEFIAKVAPTDSSVLIYGESGTGKELMARAIHRNSERAERPFVAINCAAITETLLESELFGYEKGAFTGASSQKKGKLEMAQGGTVFLDEIGELAQQLQAKLLRVLQEREFERVGGTQLVKVDLRIIAATNRGLKKAIAGGSFREDLYYRLNVLSFPMPPLRERREDIPALANHFMVKHRSRCKRNVHAISKEALAYLSNYEWPGNIRELENAIERAIVLGTTEQILPEDLPETVLEAKTDAGASTTPYQNTITDMKKHLIVKAFEQAGGKHSEAAKLLGVHPNNLYRMMKNLDLQTPK